MSKFELTRRDWLVVGSGLVVSSVLPAGRVAGDQVDQFGKDLNYLTTDPGRNAEPELSKLVQSWLTPTKHFYVRSHAPNPKIDADRFRLKIEGMVRNPQEISLKQLDEFASRTVTATLTCAGNRRAEYNREGKVGGVQWGPGAIGNATWSGAALCDLLRKVEPLEGAQHVWFEGLDQIQRDEGVIPFGASIPIQKAMIDGPKPGTLLATQMNGAALTPDHGYPLRTVVPGYIGARSVKWLGRIVVSDRPSPNHYVATAYKIVKQTDPIDWSESGPIYRYPINGVIANPAARANVPAGPVQVTGYVLPSGRPGSNVKRVELSVDDGDSWVAAELTGRDEDFCWQLWKARLDVTHETRRLTMRASDSTGAFMPGRVPWNAKGYLQNAWYRLPIRVS